MQDHAKKQVQEFIERLKPFYKAWKSFELRTGSVVVGKTEWCVLFSGRLHVLPPDQVPTAPPNPSVNRLKAESSVLPFSAFDTFINTMFAGRLEISGRSLRLGKPQQDGSLREELAPMPQFERAGETRWGRNDATRACIGLYSGGHSLHDASAGVINDHDLDFELRTLKTPYHDVEDMLQVFYMRSGGGGLGSMSKAFFDLQAPVPFILEPSSGIKDNQLTVKVSIEGELSPQKAQVGLILQPRNGVKRRVPASMTRKQWKADEKGRTATVTIDVKDVVSCGVYLGYAGINLITRTFENPEIPTANVALNAHRHFDEGMELFTKWLNGEGKHAGEELEQAVGWLFHFCGFRTSAYGGGQNLDNEVDQVCFWDEGKTLIGVECTTKSTDLIQKMKNVFRRCENLKQLLPGWDIIPAMATSMARSELTDTERHTAWTDQVVLLSADDLKGLLHVAGRNGTPADAINLISNGGSAIPPDDASGMPGLGGYSRGFRQRL